MKWLEKLDIKQHIPDGGLDEDDEVPQSVLNGVRSELMKSKLLPVGDLLENLDYVTTVEDFDNWLNEVYDEADARKVWLGL